MKQGEILCDVLTVSRLFVAIAIILISFLLEANGLQLVIFALLFGWTTDIMDGRIARRIKKRETIIGRNDIRFDAILIGAAVFYLGWAGFAPYLLGFSWSILLIVLALWPKLPHDLIQFFETPTVIVSLPVLVYCDRTLFMLLFVLAWGILLLIFDWKRAWKNFLKLQTLYLGSWLKKRRV